MRLRPHAVRLDLHLLDYSAHALQALDPVLYHSGPCGRLARLGVEFLDLMHFLITILA